MHQVNLMINNTDKLRKRAAAMYCNLRSLETCRRQSFWAFILH